MNLWCLLACSLQMWSLWASPRTASKRLSLLSSWLLRKCRPLGSSWKHNPDAPSQGSQYLQGRRVRITAIIKRKGPWKTNHEHPFKNVLFFCLFFLLIPKTRGTTAGQTNKCMEEQYGNSTPLPAHAKGATGSTMLRRL